MVDLGDLDEDDYDFDDNDYYASGQNKFTFKTITQHEPDHEKTTEQATQ